MNPDLSYDISWLRHAYVSLRRFADPAEARTAIMRTIEALVRGGVASITEGVTGS